MNIYVIRNDVSAECVRSFVLIGDEQFYFLERPWLNNQRNISCIPAGNYKARFLEKSGSGRYKKVYLLIDVPGRGGILIHCGNTVKHSKGCLIIGKRKGRLAGRRAVLNSRTALQEFREIVGENTFTINIIGTQYVNRAA